jgi:uncharacterized protein YqeY
VAETLNQRVQNDLKQAMKDRDEDRVRAIRMIRAAFIEASKEGAGEVSEERAMEALRRIRKQRVESAEQYRAGGRPELAEAEEAEMRVIDGYLPKLADEAQTRAWVKEAIAAVGATNRKEVGKVMGAVMKLHKADVDAGSVKKIAEEELPA